MKAQTSRAPENFIPVTEQVTPVIVKIGGGDMDGDGNTDPSINFLIDSPLMPFSDQSADPLGWTEALSTKTGRIQELTIEDGDLKRIDCKVFPQPNALTSLEVTLPGGEQLVLSEVEDAPGDTYRLQVQSSRPFQILRGVAEDWKESRASFSSSSLILTFKQTIDGLNDIFSFSYTFNNPQNGVFNLDFYVDPGQ